MTGHVEPGLERNRIRPGRPVMSGVSVAVVSVWDNRGLAYRTCRACWVAMEDYARLLTDRTALGTSVVPLACSRAYPVATRIAELPDRTAAVFLTGLQASESAAVQSITAARGGRLVVSETDALTAGAAAAAVTALRGRGIPPRRGRLAVIGADRAPRLATVLRECGAGSVTNLRGRRFEGPVIRRLMVDHDVVVDLTGQDSVWLIPARTVTVPADPFAFTAPAIPGLLSALCGHGATDVTIEVLAATACAIALVTPVDRGMPELSDRRLVPAVARHVSRILDGHRPAR